MKLKDMKLFYAITALGISSVITQIITIREFLSVVQGNELVLGIILAAWLFLTGVGASFGKYIKKRNINYLIALQVIISILPFFMIAFIRNLRNIFFLPGEMLGIPQIIISSLIILLPYCLITGFLLTYACTLLSDKYPIGKVYFIDSIGEIIGGILFGFILIFIFNSFQTAAIIFMINFLGVIKLSKTRVIPISLLVMVLFFIGLLNLNNITRMQQYRGQDILYEKETPYGNIVVTNYSDQLTIYQNGLTLFATDDIAHSEETVHYAMSQIKKPRTVLLISGGISGTVNELNKYDIDIDYVEIDPEIINIGEEYIGKIDANIINTDAIKFVRITQKQYDAVIIDLPGPDTLQLNRYYSVEFFEDVKKILDEEGVLSLSVPSSENYLDEETKKLNSAMVNTLQSVFDNVLLIPGDRLFLIASDGRLSYDIDISVETIYVDAYIDSKLSPDRINYIGDSIIETKINRDFQPVLYYYSLLSWMKNFKFDFALWSVIIIGIVAIFLARTKPVSFALFTSGFAGITLELIIIFAFQIIHGYAYYMMSIIIAAFMLGLAIGAHHINRRIRTITKKDLIRTEFLIAIFAFLLPILIITFKYIPAFISVMALPILTIVIGALVGMEFPIASKLMKGSIQDIAGTLYNADLIGACIGALVSSAILIPIFGIFKVSIFVGLLNLFSGLICIRN